MLNQLRLPSHKKTVNFREPTVQDALDLSKINPNLEERAVTWWLNTLQEKPYPAENWTQEDRQVGLLLTFFMTQEEVTRQVTYTCRHCEDSHRFSADYSALATQNIEEHDKIPTVDLLDGEYQMSPLLGSDLEEIEAFRMTEPTADQLRLKVISKRLKIDSEEFTKMPMKKYVSIWKEADEKLSELHHGIDFGTTHTCPKEGLESQITLPFQINDFIPRV